MTVRPSSGTSCWIGEFHACKSWCLPPGLFTGSAILTPPDSANRFYDYAYSAQDQLRFRDPHALSARILHMARPVHRATRPSEYWRLNQSMRATTPPKQRSRTARFVWHRCETRRLSDPKSSHPLAPNSP